MSELPKPNRLKPQLSCVLGDKARARKMLDKAIELGGDEVKLRALDDPDLLGVWS